LVCSNLFICHRADRHTVKKSFALMYLCICVFEVGSIYC